MDDPLSREGADDARQDARPVPDDAVLDDTVLDDTVLDDTVLDTLGGALLWRVGRVTDDGPVTVRVGFATAAPLFAELPRLRTATDAEVEEAIRERSVAVEWVGPRPPR